MGVKLHVDLETLQLIEGPGFRNPVTSLRFKRGDAALLEVSFLEGGTTAVAIGDPATLEIRLGIKPRNRYDIGYLVHDAAWTIPAVNAENPVYQCSPSFNTAELDSALGLGSATGSELAEITLMGEITWREGDGQPTSTRTFLVVVENDVNRGTEATPLRLPGPEEWLEERVTTASILAKLKGLANNPAKIGAELLPPLDVTQLAANAILHSQAQSLTDPQKTTARGNLGLGQIAINPAILSPSSGLSASGIQAVDKFYIGDRRIIPAGHILDFGSTWARFEGIHIGGDYFPIASAGSAGGIYLGAYGSSSAAVEVRTDLRVAKSIYVGTVSSECQISYYNSKFIMGGGTSGYGTVEASQYRFPNASASLQWSGSSITTGSSGNFTVGGLLTANTAMSVGGSLTTNGSTYVGGTLTTNGSTYIGGMLSTAGSAVIGGTLSTGVGGVVVNGAQRISTTTFKSSDGSAGTTLTLTGAALSAKSSIVIKDGIITTIS